MHEFVSWVSYAAFARSVTRKSRYVFEDHVEQFLDAVLATCHDRRLELPSKTVLWRAQLGHAWRFEEKAEGEIPTPFPPERMKPIPNSGREGRVNPKGIPCLYLATDKETAMAEVRPWMGSYVSAGQFMTLKDRTLVNCSVGRDYEPDIPKREKTVWDEIDLAFSEPINPDDSSANYVPTQILAEAFRSKGYDGIAYKSALGKGLNIALFDIMVAELVNCHLYQVKKVSFEFIMVGSPYWTGG